MCKVSVLVPVYNVKKYLRQCLDSLASQTLESIEFVCIDDGSTDGCSEILDEYAARDVRFRVIHKANSGYGASMNVGLRVARGEYIGIVESDDFADAEMFAALYEAAEHACADVVKSNCLFFTEAEGDRFYEMLRGLPYQKICSAREVPELLQTDTFVWTSLYRRKFLVQNDIWFHETPGASYQDVAFSLKVSACGKRMFLLRKGYLHYRLDNADASSRKIRQKLHCYHDEFAEYWKFVERHGNEVRFVAGAAAYNMWRIYRTSCWPNVGRREKVRYLGAVAEEFLQLREKGMLQKENWPQEEWQDLQDLMDHLPEKKFACMQKVQAEEFMKCGFVDCLQRAPRLYLYGAGQVARGLLKIFFSQDIRVSGMLVDCTEGNPSEILDLPVYPLSLSPADRRHDVIVIAVTPRRPEVQQEIFFALEQAGYRNIIVLTEELRQALAQA